MKMKILFTILLLFIMTIGYSQINSVALVGEAAGGWPGDPGNPLTNDVHQMSTTDGVNWTLGTIILTSAATNGGVKFRANNDWAINWGNASFPSGTGTQNGPNIVCTAGSYSVTFNSTTGVYNFTTSGTIHSVKLVGTTVPTSGEVALSTSDLVNYTISNITLINGNGQFSIDNVLSGNNSFPSGILLNSATQIPVAPGTYTSVTLNINTGAYNFSISPIPTIAIVGSGAGGWPIDPGYPPIDLNQMSTTDGINYTKNSVFLTVGGEIKFRANNAWTTSWGGGSFPNGPQTGNELANITIANFSAYYRAVLNRNTGVYAFDLPVVSIVGDAVGGWPGDPGYPATDIHSLSTSDGETYTLNSLAVTNGIVKFRQDNAWSTSWGNSTFPSATTSNGNNIPTVAGTYDVTFNRSTGAYSFTPSLFVSDFNKSNLKIYPNPTQTQWNIISNNEIINSIDLYDVLGKKILSNNPNELTANIDASVLSPGIYFAQIQTATLKNTLKVIKN